MSSNGNISAFDNKTFTDWCYDMCHKYMSKLHNAFILTGNIGDYAFGSANLEKYLANIGKRVLGMSCILKYDSQSRGELLDGQWLGERTEDAAGPVRLSEICNLLERGEGRAMILIKYPQSIMPACPFNQMKNEQASECIMLHRALSSRHFINSEHMVIIVTESLSDINPMFYSSNIRTFQYALGLPDEPTRYRFISTRYDKLKEKHPEIDLSLDTGVLTRLTAGLTSYNIEDLFLQAIAGEKISQKTILDKKKEIIQREYGSIIELMDASGSSLDDFAGQDKIKKYFKEVVIDALSRGDNSIVPKGVLLMGPPGTGKSFFAKCLAGSAGINFVEFKMSKILDKYVGEAEKNLEKAFAVFRALAPVGVFIDEIDQALSRGNEDTNAVRQNLFGMFLSELSKPENRGKIIWLGATNYPNNIDEALKRPGRFDKKIPFFIPDSSECEDIIKKCVNRTKKLVGDDVQMDEIAAKVSGYTQAEIESIVVKANELAVRRGCTTYIRNEDFFNAIRYMVPMRNKKIAEMEEIALRECNDLEFLSEKYITRWKELSERLE